MLRKAGINFSPIKKMAAGFIIASFAMTWAAVLQYYIYKSADYYENPREEYRSPINVWAVTGAYVLIGLSEILASVTTLEYAFTKAPKSMRSLVMSIQLFTNAFSAALSQAWAPLTVDPYVTWNYGSVAILAFTTGIAFWFAYRKMDAEEDDLNMLPTGHIGTQTQAEDVERRASLAAEKRASVTAQ
jgi:POT family proton-dependent oligopeptide transporter